MNGLDFGTAIGLIKGLGSPDPAVIESAVSEWLDDHPEATTTVQDGSITKAKLDSNLQGTVDDVADLKSAISDDNGNQIDLNDFVKSVSDPTKNLFTGTFKSHSNMNNSTGVYNYDVAGNANTVACEEFIPVTAGETYHWSLDGQNMTGVTVYMFFYDGNKSFLSYDNHTTATAPTSAKYVRIKLYKSNSTEQFAANKKYQLEKGTSATAYIPPYATRLLDGSVTGNKIESAAITTDKIAEKAVTVQKSEYFKQTKNIFTGSFVAYSNCDSSGVYGISDQNVNTVATEEYIEVEAGTEYVYLYANTHADSHNVFEYDASKVFIQKISMYGNQVDGYRFTTSSTTKYVRVQMFKLNGTEQLATATKIQLEKGNKSTEYVSPLMLDESLYKHDAEETEDEYKIEALSDTNLKNAYIRNKMISNMSENVSRTAQSTAYGELLEGTKAVLGRHTAKYTNMVRFGFITDIHLGGTRTTSNNPTYNIAALIALANSENLDFVVNGGDMITDYYDATYMADLTMAGQTEGQVHDLFNSLTVPYYLAKGNHEIGINGYAEAATPSTYSSGYYGYDTESMTYYRITEDNFDAYKASGGTFYTASYTYFTNQAIQEICLAGYCDDAVFNESDLYGWYYYVDINEKLRLIVLNDFYNINDQGGTGGNSRSPYEADWIASVLSDALSGGLPVLTISHTSSGLANSTVVNSINSFVNDGGEYVGHIHGHEHSDVYQQTSGYNNIGVNASLIAAGSTTKYTGYVFDVFEIDLDNKTIREIRTGAYNDVGSTPYGKKQMRSEDRLFDYQNPGQIV